MKSMKIYYIRFIYLVIIVLIFTVDIIAQTTGLIQATLKNWDNTLATPSLTQFIHYPPSSGDITSRDNPAPLINLAPGEYRVEGYQRGPLGDYEFWGSTRVNVTAGKTTPANITRNTPYVEDFWFEHNGVRINPSDFIAPGTVLTPRARIQNRSTESWSVTVEIGYRYGSGTTAATRSSSFVITAGNPYNATFETITLSSSNIGEIYAYSRTRSSNANNPQKVTDSNDWKKICNISWGLIQATLRNWDNTLATPSLTQFIHYPPSSGDITSRDNPAPLINLAPGEYRVEGYQRGPLGDYEFWGSTRVNVTAGKTTPANITRNTPYVEDFWFEHNGVRINPSDFIAPGTVLTPRARIQNRSTESWSVTVEIGYRYGSGTTAATRSSSFVITAGNPYNATFETITLSSSNIGEIYAYSRTRSSNANNPQKVTDSNDWTLMFQLNQSVVITNFDVPTGTKIRGTTHEIKITVKNISSTSRSFWIGLSFANQYTSLEKWPVGWYDVYPKQSGIIAPGNSEVISFDFTIPRNWDEGQYYATTAIWDSFDEESFLMVGIPPGNNPFDKLTNHPEFTDKPDVGKLTFTLEPFDDPIPLTTVFEELITAFENVPLASLYQSGIKPLLFLSVKKEVTFQAGVIPINISAGGVIFFDLADLCEFTPEGKDGWTTVWIASKIGGITYEISSDSEPSPVDAGLIFQEFDYNKKGIADLKIDELKYGQFSLPGLTITLCTIEQDGSIKWLNKQTGGSFKRKFKFQGADATNHIYQFEISSHFLKNAFELNNFSYSVSGLKDYIERVLEIIKTFNAPNTYRSFTYDDGYWDIQNGILERNLAMVETDHSWLNSKNCFKINVPNNVKKLTISTNEGVGRPTNGYGDLRIFWRKDHPVFEEGEFLFDGWSDYQEGSVNENCVINNPQPGVYYIALPIWGNIAKRYENVTLVATYEITNNFLTLSAPNGGETWLVGSEQTIKWTSNETTGRVNIEYSVDNGSTWTDIISGTPDVGSFSWTIPDAPSTNCLVRISDTNGSLTDQSDEVFTIAEIAVQGVSVQPTTMSLVAGEATGTVIATIIPNNATNKNVSWFSSNTAIATVSSTGVVTPVAPGTANIVVTTANGGFTATCVVTITEPSCTPPDQPGSISGPTNVCQGSTQIFSVSAVTGATSYTWLLPAGWTSNESTSNTITVTSGANSGTISVKGNNACGSSSPRTLNVTVTQIPQQPGPITGPTQVTTGTTVTYSINPVEGAIAYTWTLPAGWTSNDSTSNTINVTPENNALSGNISVTANNHCGSSRPTTINVTVAGCTPPDQPGNISGPANVCQGSTQTYSISVVTGATSYTWLLPAGWTSNESTSDSITVTPGSGSGIISVTANNSCGESSPRTLAVTVTQIPQQPGQIIGPLKVTKDTTVTYSILSVTGATSYTWTLPSGWAGESNTTSINATPGSNAKSGNISVTANNSCGSSRETTINVIVADCTPPDQPGTISGLANVCQESTQTYSVSAVTGATSYTWLMPAGWTSNKSNSNTITVTPGANSGTISVTANNACGSSSPRTLNVTVTQIPQQPGPITGSTNVCQGSNQTYSIPPVTEATSYTWTLPAGWTGNSNTNSITITTDANSGTISVTANNSCGESPPSTLAVTVTQTPQQPEPITGPTQVTPGTTVTYCVTPVTGVEDYTWALPVEWSGNSKTNCITVTVGDNAQAGNISVTANNNCGSSSPSSLYVKVEGCPPPNQLGPITGPISVCQGESPTYSVAPVAGATSYTWTLPAGWIGNSNSNSITVIPGNNAQSGNISVTANNSCGASSSRTLAVTVTQIPQPPGPITGPTPQVIPGTTITLCVAPVTGATSYTWILPAGWTGNSNSNCITVTPSANSGTIAVTANNSCGSSGPTSLYIISIGTPPNQPGPILGATSVCQGASQTYSVSAVTGATSYTWTLPAGWTGNSNSNSITVTPSANSGTIAVTANNSYGASSPRTLAVTVTQIPQPPVRITGATNVCQGASLTYSVLDVAGATSYMWTLPAGWTGNSNSNSITVTPGNNAQSGNISVTANNSCGASSSRTLAVTVTQIPVQPGPISGSPNVCQGASQTYSVPVVTGATTYTWMLPAGWSGSSNSNSITITETVNSGTISVTANNFCGSSTPGTLSVKVIPILSSQPGEITGPALITSGTTVTYSISPVSGATSYTWTLPSEWSGTSNTSSITALAGNPGIISVKARNNCSESPLRSITVKEELNCPTPEIIIKWNDVLICSNVDSSIIGYQWYYGPDLIPGANKQYYLTSKRPGEYCVETFSLNGCITMSNTIKISEPKSLLLYPNPTRDFFTLSIKDEPVGTIQIKLYSLSGIEVLCINSLKDDFEFIQQVPSNILDKGLYVLHALVDNRTIYISKIEIQK